jgi:hypothetical protein
MPSSPRRLPMIQGFTQSTGGPTRRVVREAWGRCRWGGASFTGYWSRSHCEERATLSPVPAGNEFEVVGSHTGIRVNTQSDCRRMFSRIPTVIWLNSILIISAFGVD